MATILLHGELIGRRVKSPAELDGIRRAQHQLFARPGRRAVGG
jgi:hypothetical protein